MPRNPFLAPVVAILFFCNEIRADEPVRTPLDNRAVQVEFLLIDAAAGVLPADATGEQIMELLKQGKLSDVTRLKLTAHHEQTAEVQFGEQAPVEVSRMQSPRGDVGNFQYQNHGLIVTATPFLQPDNMLQLEFSLNRSRLAPVRAQPVGADAPPKSFAPPKMETFQTKTRLVVASGRPMIVAQRELSAQVGSSTVLLVVAAIRP
jgi:hypothetical protein